MRVLVCGGRGFTDLGAVFTGLWRIHDKKPISLVIEGGAKGADRSAHDWAEHVGVPTIRFRADWKRLGPAAGPIRNQRMLDEGKPDLVVAFPGGKGTANMKELAKKAGVEVVEAIPPSATSSTSPIQTHSGQPAHLSTR